jgi:hypothetical protein
LRCQRELTRGQGAKEIEVRKALLCREHPSTQNAIKLKPSSCPDAIFREMIYAGLIKNVHLKDMSSRDFFSLA